MPSLASVVRKFSNQTLVYWQKTASDKHGRPTFADPVELQCRWEDRDQEIISSDSRTTTRARTYILIPSQLTVGSIVMRGLITDWQAQPTYPAVPTMNQGAVEVILVKTMTDIKGRTIGYEVYA